LLGGVGVLGGAAMLGGAMWLVHRQATSGDVLKLRLVHEVDPETRKIAEQYIPVLDQLSKKGFDVNLRFGPGRQSSIPSLPRAEQTGYLPPEETSSMASFNLLNFIAPDLSILSDSGKSPVSDRFDIDIDSDDDDLVKAVLGDDDSLGDNYVAEGLGEEDDFAGDDELGEDFGEDGEKNRAFLKAAGRTAAVTAAALIPGAGVVAAGAAAFLTSGPGKAFLQKIKSGVHMTRDEHRRIFEIVPVMSYEDLMQITRNPFRSKRVKTAALHELETRRRQGRAPAPQRAGLKPNNPPPAARPQAARPQAARPQAIRPQAARPQARPVPRAQPAATPQRAQPGYWRKPAPQSTSSSMTKTRPKMGEAFGAEAYSLVDAWSAHPWQTLAATLGVLVVGVAIDRSGVVDKAVSAVRGGAGSYALDEFAY
jgi:hypothetical protein